MADAFLYDAVRTPFGRYAGALAGVRPDDLGALVIRETLRRAPSLEAERIDEIVFGCANGAGEDNRNVGRMSAPACRGCWPACRRRCPRPPSTACVGRAWTL